jgi:plasmid stability protein
MLILGKSYGHALRRNVPDDLYESLRKRARSKRRCIAAEVLALLEENIPSEKELKRRRAAFQKLKKLRFTPSPGAGPFPSSEEMLREDRER